ncbi:DUF4595 domain-containing protein [Larkinella soli]|uniref:DUF4595 domain-containing protein n=1 Tax=Larkinella soli TaxID=1770527 RepID=UPI000FFB0E0E|nr:DUF4595 domain-containing protein [Larkinella soli]
MKPFLKTPAVLLALGMALALASCEDPAGLAPADPNTLTAQSGSRPTAQSTSALSTYGNFTLDYYPSGKLRRVTNNASEYTEYTYPTGREVVASTFENKHLKTKTTYTLDPNGRCSLAHVRHFENGVLKTERDHELVYNSDGQLVKIYDREFPNDRDDLTYNGDGDLVRIVSYWTNGAPWRTVEFGYPAGPSLIEDKHPLNFEFLKAVDPYLTIFGKPSKHLYETLLWKTMPGNTTAFDLRFGYKLNAGGYVTERQTTGTYTQTTQYGY